MSAVPRILHLHSTFDAGGKELRCVRLINAFGSDAEHAIVSGDPAGGVFSDGGAITIQADDMDLIDRIFAGGGIVTLRPKSGGVLVDLGSDSVGNLGLTDAELDKVSLTDLVAPRLVLRERLGIGSQGGPRQIAATA